MAKSDHAGPPEVRWRSLYGTAHWRLIPPLSRDMVFGYIDPGAGSMVIQALLAGLLAVPFFFRTQVSRFVQRIRNPRGRSEDDSAEG